MSKLVQLQEYHSKNGHIVDFAGFRLPLWFKGIVTESLAVRNKVGVFDVSHMGRMTLEGDDSCKFLERVTTNHVASLKVRDGHYSLICNEEGGIKDDLMIFRLADYKYLVVYNAANRSKDYDWFLKNVEGKVELRDISDETAMFAIQGPNSVDVLQKIGCERVGLTPRFCCAWSEIANVRCLITRTGYTGEDGFELTVWDSPVTSPQKSVLVWEKLLEAGRQYGIEPCGLGARDLLRLEAGLCLYGTDIDEGTDPYEARLGFVVKLKKDFIGRARLAEIKQRGIDKSRIGLITVNRVIPRHGYQLLQSRERVGQVTSGSLSPILGKGIAMGYVQTKYATADSFEIIVRDRSEEAKQTKPPFYDTTKYGYARKN